MIDRIVEMSLGLRYSHSYRHVRGSFPLSKVAYVFVPNGLEDGFGIADVE